jgi:hypothetical protein
MQRHPFPSPVSGRSYASRTIPMRRTALCSTRSDHGPGSYSPDLEMPVLRRSGGVLDGSAPARLRGRLWSDGGSLRHLPHTGPELDAFLEARTRAGRPIPLAWHHGAVSIVLDGRAVTLRGRISPPFGIFRGTDEGPPLQMTANVTLWSTCPPADHRHSPHPPPLPHPRFRPAVAQVRRIAGRPCGDYN